jgi:hypothetical protein
MNSGSCVPRKAAANLAITAGAGQNGLAQTGLIVDRMAANWPQAMALIFTWTTTLTATKTLTFGTVTVQHGQASNLSDAATFYAPADTVVATGALTASPGVLRFQIDLKAAGRYLRLLYTPTLSNTGTDTAEIASLFEFDEPYTSPTL